MDNPALADPAWYDFGVYTPFVWGSYAIVGGLVFLLLAVTLIQLRVFRKRVTTMENSGGQ